MLNLAASLAFSPYLVAAATKSGLLMPAPFKMPVTSATCFLKAKACPLNWPWCALGHLSIASLVLAVGKVEGLASTGLTRRISAGD